MSEANGIYAVIMCASIGLLGGILIHYGRKGWNG